MPAEHSDRQPPSSLSVKQHRSWQSLYAHPLPWLLVLQLLIALPSLRQMLWLDEAYSAIMARKTFSEIIQTLHHDAGPPLYYFILRLWRWIGGESELALRLLSWIFSAATTFIIYRFAKRNWNLHTAVFASLLWIVNPVSVMNACQVRNYTLFAFLAVLFLDYLCELEFRFGWRSWIGLTVCMVLSVYNHNLAWFMILAGMVTAVVMSPRMSYLKYLASAFVITVLFYLSWLPVLFEQMEKVALTIDWVQRVWSPWVLLSTVNTWIPGGETPPYIPMPTFSKMLHLVFLVLWFIALVPYFLSKRLLKNFASRWVLLMILMGVGGPYLYSLIAQPLYLVGRSDFFVLPFWCMLSAYAVVYGWRGWMTYMWIVFMIGISVYITLAWHFRSVPYSENDVTRFLQRRGDRGDLVVCTGLTRPTLEYYLKPHGFRFLSFPLDMEKHLAHINERWYFENTDVEEYAKATINVIPEKIKPQEEFWVIASDRSLTRVFLQELENDPRFHHAPVIKTPSMGLRRLNEPIYILPYEYRP